MGASRSRALIGCGRQVAAHEGRLQGQRLGQLGVLERLPVQGVERGRAGDLDRQIGQVALGRLR